MHLRRTQEQINIQWRHFVTSHRIESEDIGITVAIKLIKEDELLQNLFFIIFIIK